MKRMGDKSASMSSEKNLMRVKRIERRKTHGTGSSERQLDGRDHCSSHKEDASWPARGLQCVPELVRPTTFRYELEKNKKGQGRYDDVSSENGEERTVIERELFIEPEDLPRQHKGKGEIEQRCQSKHKIWRSLREAHRLRY